MEDYPTYRSFDLEQWLENSDFLRWAKHPDMDSDSVFRSLLEENSETSHKMKIAMEILQSMNSQEKELTDQEIDTMWNNVKEKAIKLPTSSLRRTRSSKVWLSIAAVLVIAFLSMTYIVWNKGRSVDYLQLAEQIQMRDFNEANLLIPGQSNFVIGDKMQIVFGKDGKTSIQSASGEMLSFANSNYTDKQTGVLVVPKGKRASMVFADGTQVVVHPGSKVVFPMKFQGKRRELFIEGEAFFHVSKNKHWPFVVKTDRIGVEVLGTSFNVKAYPQSSVQSVVLVTGSVKVNTDGRNAVRIRPNQEYSFDKTRGMETVENIDVSPLTSWKDGYLLFDSQNLNVVFAELSNYYGVHFNYSEQQVKNIRLSGKLDLNSSLEHILQAISAMTQVHFHQSKIESEINVEH